MSKPSDKTRLSRYRPDRKAFPDFQPSERHQRILLLVHAHRFLDTELLWHLLRVSESETPAQGVKSGFGMEALYKALQKMFNAGYLNRHFLYDVPIGRGKGTPPTVYGLGTKSARLLSEVLGCSPRDIQDIVEANKVKTPFLRHALEIARFRVTLELACMASGGEKKLLFWEQGQGLKETVTAFDAQGNERKFSVYPDAMFALELEGKGRACYFLEIDRGTMPIRATTERPDLIGKFIGYRKFREKKMMERKFGYRVLADGTVAGLAINERPFDDVEPPSGVKPIPGFNVLFVMPGSIDVEGKPKGRIRNCLAELMALGAAYSTSSLFWFTPPESYTIEEPKSILKNIWITSNAGQGLQSLVE
ncbi:MAG: replication-relaxation family protein [Candidatus Kerfeldbacteria bacterium]|nr:replication-relaxation family protein [Candidatus Kerfeldbacteria bacterium]